VLGVRCWVLGGRRIADCGVSPEFPVGQEFFFKISEIGPSLFGLRSHCKGEGEDVRGPGVGCLVLGAGGLAILRVRSGRVCDCRFAKRPST